MVSLAGCQVGSLVIMLCAAAGLTAALTLADLHNPGRVGQIGVELFGRTAAMAEGMNIFTDAFAMATVWVSAVLVMLGFFVLAMQLFVSLIAFKLGSLAAFVALPWGVFNGTSWVAERPLGWVAGCAIRLFVLAFIASIAITFVNTLPATFTLNAGGVLNVFLFGLTVLALAWFAPMLASEVVQGQPHLSGSDAIRTGVGATFATAGGVYMAHAVYKAVKGGMMSTSNRLSGGGGRGMKAIAAHFRYISKNGRLEIEDQRGDYIESETYDFLGPACWVVPDQPGIGRFHDDLEAVATVRAEPLGGVRCGG